MPRHLRRPSLETLFVATFALGGFAVGARPIGDNSTFVHLRTGIDLVAGAGIPRADPYSFTARGARWVVQSWLPAGLYGWAERIGGLLWVVLLQGILMGLLAWTIARLARTGSPLRTMVAGGIAVGVGYPWWSPRPLLFGLLALALTLLVVERRWSPWWLVPVVWVWVQSHGSFPLGALWIGLTFLGAWIDRRAWPADLLRYVMAFAVGLVVAAVNPLGPRLLTFAVTVGEKREVFRSITEWRTADFQSEQGLVTTVFLMATVVVLARRRPAWVHLLPVAVFFGLGLLALRNLAVLGVVLAPVLGAALRAEPVGAPASERDRPHINLYFAGVLMAATLLFALNASAGEKLRLDDYPVASARWLEREGFLDGPGGRRVAAQDIVGCYLVLRDGREADVFIDDRFDMYPVRVSNDLESLLRGRRDSVAILDRYRIDAVLWDAQQPLATILDGHPDWRTGHTDPDGDWVVFVRR